MTKLQATATLAMMLPVGLLGIILQEIVDEKVFLRHGHSDGGGSVLTLGFLIIEAVALIAFRSTIRFRSGIISVLTVEFFGPVLLLSMFGLIGKLLK